MQSLVNLTVPVGFSLGEELAFIASQLWKSFISAVGLASPCWL